MKLEEKLVEVIEQAQKAGAEAFLFTKEQAPDIINQLLIWQFWSGILVGLFCFIILSLMATIYFITLKRNNYRTDGFIEFIFLMLGTLPAIVGVCHIGSAIKIYLAPKVYLLEYAASLINK